MTTRSSVNRKNEPLDMPREDVPDVRCPKVNLHTFNGTDFAEGKAQISTDQQHLLITEPSAGLTRVKALQTCGDGACAIHAVYGQPSSSGNLYKQGARNLATILLGRSAEKLEESGERVCVKAIRLSFWNEFIEPALRGTA